MRFHTEGVREDRCLGAGNSNIHGMFPGYRAPCWTLMQTLALGTLTPTCGVGIPILQAWSLRHQKVTQLPMHTQLSGSTGIRTCSSRPSSPDWAESQNSSRLAQKRRKRQRKCLESAGEQGRDYGESGVTGRRFPEGSTTH